MDATGLAPDTADSNASVEAAQVDSEAVDAEGADPAAAAADTGKPPRDRVQERIDQLTREKYENASRADKESWRREQLEREIAELRAAQTAKPQTVAPSDDYPTLESVGWDESKHAAAVAEWSAKQAREAARAELAAEREASERERSNQTWQRREAEFIKSKPDYSEKVLRSPAMGGPSITDHMAQVIQASDIGPEVAYYLAENVQKSAEIARLPAYLQAREIGRIEERLAVAKVAPPPVSKAPPPVSKLDAADSVSDKDPDDMTVEEWKKWRDKRDRIKNLRK